MNAIDIKSKIKRYIVEYFDGFDEFDYHDNIVDMGITTDEFVFDFIKFLEKEFCVTIFKHELYKRFTINSIGKLIANKMKNSQSSQKIMVNV
jgi:hypothetical protein